MEVSDQLHAPAVLPYYPLDRRLGGSQSRSGRGGEEKNSQPPPPGIKPPNFDRPAHIFAKFYAVNFRNETSLRKEGRETCIQKGIRGCGPFV
jgi:hypothetical protein